MPTRLGLAFPIVGAAWAWGGRSELTVYIVLWPFLEVWRGILARSDPSSAALPAWHLCNTQQKSSMTRSVFTYSAFSPVSIARVLGRGAT